MGWLPFRAKMLQNVNGACFVSRSPSVWQAFLDWTARARIAAFAHQAMWLHSLDLRPILPEVNQPVLLVVGDRDRVVPMPLTDVLYQHLPSAGRAVIEGCGHLPHYTHPEVYAELVRRFFTPPGASCAATCPASGMLPGCPEENQTC
jgi:pimeloyl-ACP methyl ester carboxylesterase